jgi:CMP-N,N'-diacetyllegionaminic acid synthase
VIAGLSVVALVPARGGSKGVKRKNVREVAGRPLIAWTLDAANASRYIDRTVLSSEDEEIMRVARDLGCEVPFRRPEELSQDDTPGIEPVLHAIKVLTGYDLIVLLQPTSPLRIAADIDACLERLVAVGAPACVSVREALDHPYWCYTVDAGGRLRPLVSRAEGEFVRRQQLPQALTVNGAVYVARTNWLANSRNFLTNETVCVEMPLSRSLDVDTEADLVTAESSLSQRPDQPHLLK